MRRYKTIIKNGDATLSWELPYQSFSFSEELNKDRSAQVSFDFNELEAIGNIYGVTPQFILAASYRELYIYDEDDVLLYGGYISEQTFSRQENGDRNISIASKGFFNLFAKRFTGANVSYSAQDLSDIAWDLIDDTQNLTYGDFGITRGANPTTRDADRTYQYKSIKEAIEKLSNSNTDNGIDFDISSAKLLNVYYPERGSQLNNIVFEEGFNILNYTIREIFIDGMVNQVFVFGEGQYPDMLVEQRDSAAIYKSNFFLLQDTLSEKDTKVAATLQSKGDTHIEDLQQPRYVITATCQYEDPGFSEYNLGDRVKVKIDSLSIDDFFRVTRRSLNDKGNVNLSFFAL